MRLRLVLPNVRMFGNFHYLQSAQLCYLDGADEQFSHVDAIYVHVDIGAPKRGAAPKEDVIEKQEQNTCADQQPTFVHFYVSR